MINEERVCRLCGSQAGVHVPIFDGPEECLSKIELIVPDIVILRYDSLPKYICHMCLSKVKTFHEFRETCITTQKILKEQYIPWTSMTASHTCFRPTVPSPTVLFIGGPLAYPYEDKEVEVLTLSDDETDDTSTQKCSLESELTHEDGNSINGLRVTPQTSMKHHPKQVQCDRGPPLHTTAPHTRCADSSHREPNTIPDIARPPLQKQPLPTDHEALRIPNVDHSLNTSSSSSLEPPLPDRLSSEILAPCVEVCGISATQSIVPEHCNKSSKSNSCNPKEASPSQRRSRPKPKCKQKISFKGTAGFTRINISPNNTIFTCNKCNKIFIKRQSLSEHCCEQVDGLKKPNSLTDEDNSNPILN